MKKLKELVPGNYFVYYNCPHTPQLNNIEYVFAMVDREFRRLNTEARGLEIEWSIIRAFKMVDSRIGGLYFSARRALPFYVKGFEREPMWLVKRINNK